MLGRARLRWIWLLGAVLVGAAALAALPERAVTNVLLRDLAPEHTRLHIRIFDGETKAPLAALVRFRAQDGQYLAFGNLADLPGWGQGASATELGLGEEGLLAFRHGMAVWQGEANIIVGRSWDHRDVQGAGVLQSQVFPGIYQLEITHGPEYDMFTQSIDLSPGRGRIKLDVPLRRAFETPDYVSADLHVHHAPDSRDAQLDARGQLKIAAVNGLDAFVAANHERAVDLRKVAEDLWQAFDAPVKAFPGVEHEASNAHFGVFPVQPQRTEPGQPPLARPWPLEVLLADLRALPGSPLIIGYHPRLGWKAYLDAPYCGPWAGRDFSLPPPCPQGFDAIEVLSAWQTCGSRQREVTESWLALLSYNHVSAAIGSSDSHFASAMLPGYPRTWVRVRASKAMAIGANDLVAAIRNRHTVASTAPFVTVRVGKATEGDFIAKNSGPVLVRIRVRAANWVPVDSVSLLVNGSVVKTWEIPQQGKALDFEASESLTLGKDDVFITAETDSRKPLPDGVVGEYSSRPEFGLSRCPPRSGEPPGMPAYAVTSPLFIDRDGDGRFRGHRASASTSL